MSNLLQGLAMALGGGLRGYSDWKMYDNENKRQDAEQKRRDAMMAEETANRRRQAGIAEMRARADMADAGITEGPTPTGKLDFGGTGLGAHFIPKISIDNDKRFRDIGGGFKQDYTQSRAGREASARQARAKELSDTRFAEAQEGQQLQGQQAALVQKRTGLLQRAMAGDRGAKAELGAMDPVYGRQLLEPPTPRGGGGPNLGQNNAVLDDFRTETKPLRDAVQGYGALTASAQRARAGNQAATTALLYSFAKVLDPGSVVREGEFNTLTKIGSVDQRIQKAIQLASKGTLPPDLIDYIEETANAVMGQHMAGYDNYRTAASQRARASGVGDIFEQSAPDAFGPYRERLGRGAAGPVTDDLEAGYSSRGTKQAPSHDKLYLPPMRQR